MNASNTRGLQSPWTTDIPGVTRQHASWERHLRCPCSTDAVAMRRLVDATGVLDVNSTYAYLLLATDFAKSSIVAERDGELCGLITGYHPPERPEVLFVWQVAVTERARGTGLAAAMLDELVNRVRRARHGHPLTVEATVAPSNGPSRAFFGGFARRHGVPMTERPYFGAELLDPEGEHEDEPILSIGPIAAALSD
ncbi:diaminobutyrate acetyltransferase [Mycobacterium sp. SA01]|uniref:diaminobutyrate acetyltransferase n=1 Tax=Mycobacterium sp. SA01 TaxID=3238820 RepID=UPI00351AE0DB